MAEEAAVAVHQARDQRGIRGGAGDVAAYNSGGVVNVDRFVAVFFDHAFQARGDGVQRFFPGDTLKLAFSAFAHAFHRIVQTVWVINATAN